MIRVSLPAARLSRIPTRKRRNIALGYYRYSRSAQAYATRSGKGKIGSRRRQQPDDGDQEEEEEKEGAKPPRAAAESILSDSLFIFRRASAHPLLSVCAVLFT